MLAANFRLLWCNNNSFLHRGFRDRTETTRSKDYYLYDNTISIMLSRHTVFILYSCICASCCINYTSCRSVRTAAECEQRQTAAMKPGLHNPRSAGINLTFFQGVASYRVPMILLRKTGTSSEICSKNLGRLGETEGRILKVRFSTASVPFTQTQVS